MVKQVKFIVGKNLQDLEEQLNTYLCDIDCESCITYDFDKFIAVIETKVTAPTHICCECKHWSDNGNAQAIEGECVCRSIRRKFKDHACGKWEGR